MPEKYKPNLENEKENFEKELDKKLAREEELEEKFSRIKPRKEKKQRKHIPYGGTFGAEEKRLKAERFRLRTRKKPEIKIIDKTKK
jgi:hypothetical protein